MFEQFRKKFKVSNNRWNDYVSCFKRMEVPGKTTLLKEGEIPKKFFVIEKGCLRVWFNNKGKDVTFQFFFENNTVASLESFKKGTPSPFAIETIEPCIIWYIKKNDIDRIIAEISEETALRQVFTEFIFERTFNYMRHFLSFVKDSPKERYLNLIQEKPQIVQRVPQHYIASYLGITTVHLSRIKSQLARQKP